MASSPYASASWADLGLPWATRSNCACARATAERTDGSRSVVFTSGNGRSSRLGSGQPPTNAAITPMHATSIERRAVLIFWIP